MKLLSPQYREFSADRFQTKVHSEQNNNISGM